LNKFLVASKHGKETRKTRIVSSYTDLEYSLAKAQIVFMN